MARSKFDNWTEINLDAIRNNIRMIAAHTSLPVMAVVKANAYGHGLVMVARAALQAGSPSLGVARYHEARELRNHGIECPILVLGRIAVDEIHEAAELQIRATLFDPDQIHGYVSVLEGSGLNLLVHAKFDTGMGRLGISAEEGVPMLQEILREPNLTLEGIYSHLARADEPDASATTEQMNRFAALVNQAAELGIRPPSVHISNSAGAWFHPQLKSCTLVRGGIAMYGLHPSPNAMLPAGFQPALSWKTNVSSVKWISHGQPVSYGGRYTVQRERERIAVISVGYADGFRRTSGNHVLISGRKFPIVGTVCMDQCMALLDDETPVSIGDEVVLIGNQGDASIQAEEVAAAWGTINYEVVCGIGQRVKRYYTEPEMVQ